jgi:lipoprotein-releasing system permease protein
VRSFAPYLARLKYATTAYFNGLFATANQPTDSIAKGLAMYKLLLCWRYLRTRWIALASVVSVTLGVATMIVVNSVMTGFTHEMQGRIHGILSDIVFETHGMNGFYDPDVHMKKIRKVAGEYIVGMTPTVVVPAMLVLDYNGEFVPRPISLIGIDPQTHDQVSDFSRFLQHPANRQRLSFELREDGYDTYDHQAGSDAIKRERMEYAGKVYRRIKAEHLAEQKAIEAERKALEANYQPTAPRPKIHFWQRSRTPPRCSIPPRNSIPAWCQALPWPAIACATAATAFWSCRATT